MSTNKTFLPAQAAETAAESASCVFPDPERPKKAEERTHHVDVYIDREFESNADDSGQSNAVTNK